MKEKRNEKIGKIKGTENREKQYVRVSGYKVFTGSTEPQE